MTTSSVRYGAIRAEVYDEVAGWLREVAAKMKRDSENTVFDVCPMRAVMDARGVLGLANALRRRAKKMKTLSDYRAASKGNRNA